MSNYGVGGTKVPDGSCAEGAMYIAHRGVASVRTDQTTHLVWEGLVGLLHPNILGGVFSNPVQTKFGPEQTFLALIKPRQNQSLSFQKPMQTYF